MSANRLIPTILAVVILSAYSFTIGCQRDESGPVAKQSDESETTSKKAESDTTKNGQSQVEPWGGLEVKTSGQAIEDAKFIVVFLHGLGANANDMKSMCSFLEFRDSTGFVFPEGPFRARNNGHAWMRNRGDFGYSRDKLIALLSYIKSKNRNAKVLLGGYSQGAIMASNLVSDQAIVLDAVVLLAPSGMLAHEPNCQKENRPKIFLAHGRQDRILPFVGSEKLKAKLIEMEFEVDWFPYDGGHGLPNSLFPRLNQFIKKVQVAPTSKD